jgi:hypothetical protein
MERTTREMTPEARETDPPETDRPEDDAGTAAEPQLATADLAKAGAADPQARTEAPARASAEDGDSGEPLLDAGRSGELRSRWESVQASFVDEPRSAVEQADGLVAEVLQDLARSFTKQRESLEKEWQLGDDVSTEELRQALRHYRSFFDRLLSL